MRQWGTVPLDPAAHRAETPGDDFGKEEWERVDELRQQRRVEESAWEEDSVETELLGRDSHLVGSCINSREVAR